MKRTAKTDEQQAMNEKGDQIIDDVNTTLAALRGPEKEAFIKVFNEHNALFDETGSDLDFIWFETDTNTFINTLKNLTQAHINSLKSAFTNAKQASQDVKKAAENRKQLIKTQQQRKAMTERQKAAAGRILTAANLRTITQTDLDNANVDFTKAPEVDIETAASNLMLVSGRLDNDTFQQQITKLAARYLFDNKDAKNFDRSPILKKLTSNLTETQKEVLTYFNELSQNRTENDTCSTLYSRATEFRTAYKTHTESIQALDIKELVRTNCQEDEKPTYKIHNYLMGNDYNKDEDVIALRHILREINNSGLPSTEKNKLLKNYPSTDIDKILNSFKTTSTKGKKELPLGKITQKPTSLQQLETITKHYKTLDKGLRTLANKSKTLNKKTADLFGGTKSSGESKLHLKKPKAKPTHVKFEQEKTVGSLTTELRKKASDINQAFNDAFEPIYGPINFTEDILPLFKGSEKETFGTSDSFKTDVIEGLLTALDNESQRIFLMDYVYPAMTIDIQSQMLSGLSDTTSLSDSAVKIALQRTATPALKEQLAGFDNDNLIKLIRLSNNGLPTDGIMSTGASPSMLSTTQLNALFKMKQSITEGKTTTVKLGAGEGKTFLSMLLPHVLGNADQPIIHVAPFAQDEVDWEELPKNLSDMEPGKHYWVRQDQLLRRHNSDEDLSELKDAALFMDEYDRAPELNKVLDNLGAMRRVNMSATDNLEEVQTKLKNYQLKVKYLFGDSFQKTLATAMTTGGDKTRELLTKKLKKEIKSIQELTKAKTIDETTAIQRIDSEIKRLNSDIEKIDAQTLKGARKKNALEEKISTLQHRKIIINKLIKWQDKIPNLVARNIEQTADELGRITSITQLDTTDSPSHNALTQMVEKACQANNNTNPTKIQMIFQGAEFVAPGVSSETGREAISISELQDQLKQLSPNGPTPVHVHMSAPKGLQGFNEGHPITMTFDGETWNIHEFDKTSSGTNVTLYDTFNKVGGDFGPHSRNVHQQYAAVSTELTGEPLTSSLMYQITKRNRGDGDRVEPTIFCTGQLESTDATTFRSSIAEEETSVNKAVVEQQQQVKKQEQKGKLFDATLTNWIHNHCQEFTPEQIESIRSEMNNSRDSIVKNSKNLKMFQKAMGDKFSQEYNSTVKKINQTEKNEILQGIDIEDEQLNLLKKHRTTIFAKINKRKKLKSFIEGKGLKTKILTSYKKRANNKKIFDQMDLTDLVAELEKIKKESKNTRIIQSIYSTLRPIKAFIDENKDSFKEIQKIPQDTIDQLFTSSRANDPKIKQLQGRTKLLSSESLTLNRKSYRYKNAIMYGA